MTKKTHKPKVEAEYHRIKEVLVHTPRDEIFLGVLGASNKGINNKNLKSTYEMPFNTSIAREQHRGYVAQLESRGIIVHQIHDLLLQSPNLLELASESLDYPNGRNKLKYKNEVLHTLSKEDLVNIVLNRPSIDTARKNIEEYKLRPLTDLMFTRDQMIVTKKGVVLGNMYFNNRRPEVLVVKYALKELGIEPIFEVKDIGKKRATLEGGDFFAMGEYVLIGSGMRTNNAAIDQLLEADVFGVSEVAVVQDMIKKQDEMHLDTYFNVLGKNAVLLQDQRFSSGNPKRIPKILLYEKHGGNFKLSNKNINFEEYLRSKGLNILPITKSQQLQYACNSLCIQNNIIFMPDRAGFEHKRLLRLEGINFDEVRLSELTKAYGGPHCTTQVLIREDE